MKSTDVFALKVRCFRAQNKPFCLLLRLFQVLFAAKTNEFSGSMHTKNRAV